MAAPVRVVGSAFDFCTGSGRFALGDASAGAAGGTTSLAIGSRIRVRAALSSR